MAKLDIITLPDPMLRQISQPIEEVGDDLRKLMDDMLETMYVAPGIGLAAIQVAVPKRLIVHQLFTVASRFGGDCCCDVASNVCPSAPAWRAFFAGCAFPAWAVQKPTPAR